MPNPIARLLKLTYLMWDLHQFLHYSLQPQFVNISVVATIFFSAFMKMNMKLHTVKDSYRIHNQVLVISKESVRKPVHCKESVQGKVKNFERRATLSCVHFCPMAILQHAQSSSLSASDFFTPNMDKMIVLINFILRESRVLAVLEAIASLPK